MIQLPIEIGDVILTGRFKNKKVTVKEIGKDEHGLPTVNGRGIMKIRIQKLMAPKVKEDLSESIRKIVRKIITEIDVTDRPDLEAEARRYAELANKIKVMEAELEAMGNEYQNLDDTFRKELEAISETKDTFIRAGKLLIKIERAAYEKKNKSYKTGFDYLYERVNKTMKQIADEAMSMIETVSKVKSKISVVHGEGVIKEGKFTDLVVKTVKWIGNKLNKLTSLNRQANSDLDKLEKVI